MRQIPSYSLIGSGKLAKHLAAYFSLSSISYTQWARKTHSLEDLDPMVAESDVIILAITDESIAPFIQQHPILQTKTIVHCSGCLSIHNAISVHPLVSFGEALFNLDAYQKIPFMTDNLEGYSQAFPTLQNKCFLIKKELKPYYHALCVISGNFSCILWAKLFKELEHTFHVPPEEAFPYLQSISQNLMNNYQTALTGPLARKDLMTINENIKALKEDPFLPVYESFTKLMEDY